MAFMKKNNHFIALVAFVALIGFCGSVWAITKTPAKDITTDASVFDKNLSTADTDVQKALKTLNDLVVNPVINWSDPGNISTITSKSGWTRSSVDSTVYLTNSSDSVGINSSSPQAKLDIISNQMTYLPSVVGKTATQSFTYDACDDSGAYNIRSSGNSWQIRVYPAKTINGTLVYSSNYYQSSVVFDNNYAQCTYYLTFSWDSVADADAYLVLLQASYSSSNFTDNFEPHYFTTQLSYDYYETNGTQAENPVTPIYVNDAALRLAGDYVQNDGTFSVIGDFGDNTISGAGTRMMWIPSKKAFRAGNVDGSQWDNANIGNHSFATGYNATASADYTTVIGNSSTASNGGATYIGYGGSAAGNYCVGIGYGGRCLAAFALSLAGGYADAYGSVSIGLNSQSTGEWATAIGYGARSTGTGNVAMGYGAAAGGISSPATNNSIAIGLYADAHGTNSTAIGNGALSTGDNSNSIGLSSQATATNSSAFGSGNYAIGVGSTALGYQSLAGFNATNGYATALGYSATASGVGNSYQLALGNWVTASGFKSVVIGTGADDANRLINNKDYSIMLGINSSTPTMTLTSTNVGIGTTNPVQTLAVAGRIGAGAGSAAKPGFSFIADDDDGMFYPATNSLGFSVDGAERMRISLNNVGIGTSTPRAMLDVNGTVYMKGNVGIGTVASISALELNGGSITPTGHLTTAGDVGIASHYWSTIRSNWAQFYNGGTNDINFSNGKAVVGTTNLVVTTAGNVGIGTSTPVKRLHVAGTTAADDIQTDTGLNLLYVTDPTAPTGVVSAGGSVDTGTHYYLVTYTTALGETGRSVSSVITTTAGNNTVTLTIPTSTDYRVTGRKIYRTKAGANNYEDFVHPSGTIADNTTTTWVDTTADASLTGVSGSSYFRMNTTNKGIKRDNSNVMFIDSRGTGFGINVFQSVTSGGRMVAIGQQALKSATSQRDSVAVGENALAGGTSGNSNVVMGYSAGLAMTTGSNNTLIGHETGYNLGTSSSNNSCLGVFACMGNGSVSSYNSAIGYYALNGITTGNYNSALGVQAGDGITTGSYNIMIGKQVNPTTLTDDRQMNIGNLIYSNSVGIGTTAATGNIGIGTSSPRYKLEVDGTTYFGGTGGAATVETSGTIVLVGSAMGYKDVFFPQTVVKSTGAGNPSLVTYLGNIKGYAYSVGDSFDADPQEYPHDGLVGGNGDFHIHWVNQTNVAAIRTVKWQIEYSQTNPMATFPATTTVSCEQSVPANTAVGYMFLQDCANFTTLGPGAMMSLRVSRIASSGTEPATAPVMLGVHYHYQVDTPAGSRNETSK